MLKQTNKLLIIDGNALIHRSFHALPPSLRTKDGVLVNAVYGFSSFLLSAIIEFKPKFVILTLDMAGPTFRHKTYKEYKATRVKAADELYDQIPLVKEVAKSLSIPIFEKSGFEADDLIGSLSLQAENEKDLEVIIVTGDLDTLQLVSPQTKVYTMSRGLSDSVIYDIAKVKERYSLSPNQIIDYKALAGDPSDNIPGAKGIGAKTATELLLKHKSIKGIYQAIESDTLEAKPRTKELLIASKDNVILSYELATIDCKAPITLSLEEAEFKITNIEGVLNLFQEFQFKSLLNKLKQLSGDNLNAKSEALFESAQNSGKKKTTKKIVAPSHKLVESSKDLKELVSTLEKQEFISLGLELDNKNLKPIALVFLAANKSYYLPYEKSTLKEVKGILENKNIKKTAYDLKLIFEKLSEDKIILAGIYFDILVAAYLINPGNRNYQLENIIYSELGLIDSDKSQPKSGSSTQLSFDLEIDIKNRAKLACEKLYNVHLLAPLLEKQLKDKALWDIFINMEMPLVSILGKMQHFGIKIDLEILANLEKEVLKKIKKLEKNIYESAGKKFNINSPKQLKEILFEDLKLSSQGIKKTKTGFSTAEDELNKLKDSHKIIPYILSYRELAKLESTYLKALPKMINPKTGRIHSHFNQVVTATGRLSSHDPNLQNIPTKTKEGRRIRKAFIAKKGYKLVGFDYSQIELRVAAHFSGDKKMVTAFKSNADIHSETAAKINEVKREDVSHKMRQEAKAINFGILYGQGPHGLSQNAGITYKKASEFIEKYFLTYPKIKEMVDGFILETKEKGYASTLIGRKRNLPEINSSMPFLRKSAERMAINTPIQGTAADIIKQAMINIANLIYDKEDEVKLILQIHDELIFEIKEDKLEEYIPQLKEIMENTTKLKVPLKIESSLGDNWDDLK